jgi:hypothetical protein
VAVYGGFAGTETARDQRNLVTNVTILSGDLNGDDVGFTNNSENVYNVVTGATGATLDGFTITAGNANVANVFDPNGNGGGMLNNSGSSPTLTNLIFSGNSTTYYGGGMLNWNSSNPTLTNVTFSGNSAGSDGGGMFNWSSSSPTLTNVTFSGNSAIVGGGMYNYLSSNPTLTNVTFSGNSASTTGGGMYNDGGSNPQIRNTIFWSNTAPSGAQIYNSGSSPVVSDSVVQDGYIGTNIITADPVLGVLGNYGGSTQTIPLLGGSSAIDTGNDAVCPATDQRGITRPVGAHCDIGSFEFVDTFAPTVETFTVTTSSNSLNIPITVFNASDNVGVTGYLITTSSTPPTAGAASWSGTTPTTFTVASDGNYTLYPWAKDAAGNISVVFTSPRAVVVDTTIPTVNAFTVTTPSNSLNIPITAFTASDAVGVTGYLITTSSTAPAAGAVSWTSTAPVTFTVASDGPHTLYPWAKDAMGNVSAVFASPRAVVVDTIAPMVYSIALTNPNPTSASSVNFTVTFSEPVSGVATNDFTLIKTGTISGESVMNVIGGPVIYTVTVNTGTGSGTLRLDVTDDDSIVDIAYNPLGGPGAGNGNFNNGETYIVRFYHIFLPLVLLNR